MMPAVRSAGPEAVLECSVVLAVCRPGAAAGRSAALHVEVIDCGHMLA